MGPLSPLDAPFSPVPPALRFAEFASPDGRRRGTGSRHGHREADSARERRAEGRPLDCRRGRSAALGSRNPPVGHAARPRDAARLAARPRHRLRGNRSGAPRTRGGSNPRSGAHAPARAGTCAFGRGRFLVRLGGGRRGARASLRPCPRRGSRHGHRPRNRAPRHHERGRRPAFPPARAHRKERGTSRRRGGRHPRRPP